MKSPVRSPLPVWMACSVSGVGRQHRSNDSWAFRVLDTRRAKSGRAKGAGQFGQGSDGSSSAGICWTLTPFSHPNYQLLL